MIDTVHHASLVVRRVRLGKHGPIPEQAVEELKLVEAYLDGLRAALKEPLTRYMSLEDMEREEL